MANAILVTKINFADYYRQNTDKIGIEGMFLKAMTGKDAKEWLEDVDNEEKLWIDLNKVVSVGRLIKVKETGDVVFSITFDCNDPKLQNMFLKGDEYEDFLHLWAGERKYLGPGTYKVGLGINPKPGQMVIEPTMWAELSEDKLTVTVREVTPV